MPEHPRRTRTTAPSYALIEATTGMSRQDWDLRRGLVEDLANYDPSDVQQFRSLLRRSMDVISGQTELAALLGASVPTLHRWARGSTNVATSLSPIQRAAMASLLSAVLIHGVAAVQRALPSILRKIKGDIAELFALQISGNDRRVAPEVAKRAIPKRVPGRRRSLRHSAEIAGGGKSLHKARRTRG